MFNQLSCISFDSYIKPQQQFFYIYFHKVVYLLIPTSNHNLFLIESLDVGLYIF